MTYFLIAEFALLAGPILGGIAWLCLRHRPGVRSLVMVIEATLILAAVLLGWFNWSLRGVMTDVIALALCYVASAHIIWSALDMRPAYLGWGVFALGSLPVVLGLILGTAGSLGVAFVTAEWEQHRIGTTAHRGLLAYEVRSSEFGNVTTEWGGEQVGVYRYSPYLPLLEQRVFFEALDFREYPLHGRVTARLGVGMNGVLLRVISAGREVYRKLIPF